MDWGHKHDKYVHTIEQLKEYISLTSEEEEEIREVVKIHPLKITKYYLSLIDPHNKNDPLRQMVIPSVDELDVSGEYDTSGEKENTKTIGLQHKYSQTALILVTNRCAAYCRHCFRKRLIGLPSKEILSRFDEAIDYLKEHKEIDNVLISGGDPFVLPTKIIKTFLEKLSTVKHLRFIRFGTRIPLVLPGRILENKSLLKLLKKYSEKTKKIYIVTHFNHPREITKKSVEAINKLLACGLIINNQTVLLKGVNDNPTVLSELMLKLTSIGVNPYYVFQCRPVKRVKHHFQIPLVKAYKIIEEAKKKLDGHSKRFKYIMAHKTGKIEIIGILKGYMYFKYHQAKDSKNLGKFFKKKIKKNAGWLDDL